MERIQKLLEEYVARSNSKSAKSVKTMLPSTAAAAKASVMASKESNKNKKSATETVKTMPTRIETSESPSSAKSTTVSTSTPKPAPPTVRRQVPPPAQEPIVVPKVSVPLTNARTPSPAPSKSSSSSQPPAAPQVIKATSTTFTASPSASRPISTAPTTVEASKVAGNTHPKVDDTTRELPRTKPIATSPPASRPRKKLADELRRKMQHQSLEQRAATQHPASVLRPDVSGVAASSRSQESSPSQQQQQQQYQQQQPNAYLRDDVHEFYPRSASSGADIPPQPPRRGRISPDIIPGVDAVQRRSAQPEPKSSLRPDDNLSRGKFSSDDYQEVPNRNFPNRQLEAGI